MFQIIGIIVVIGSVIAGYTMHNGKLAVLWQPSEFLIIGGAGLGAFLIANPMSVVKGSISSMLRLLRPTPFNKKSYGELLQVLFDVLGPFVTEDLRASRDALQRSARILARDIAVNRQVLHNALGQSENSSSVPPHEWASTKTGTRNG